MKRDSQEGMGSKPLPLADQESKMNIVESSDGRTLYRVAIFLLVYFMFYEAILSFDRGSWDAVIKKTIKFYSIDKAEGGLIGSVLIAGFLVGCAATGLTAKYVNPFKIMYFALFFWVAADIFAGVSNTYPLILTARFFDGFFEAPVSILLNPLINAVAPPGANTKWIGLVTLPGTLGAAIGVFCAPAINNSFGSILWIFRFEALMVLSLCIPPLFLWKKCCKAAETPEQRALIETEGQPSTLTHLRMGEENLNDEDPDDIAVGRPRSKTAATKVAGELWELLRNKMFVCLCLGSAAQQFSFNGLSYWGVQYLQDDFNLSDQDAAFYAGSVAGVFGLISPLLGGLFLDHLLRAVPKVNTARRLQISMKWIFLFGTVSYVIIIPCILSGQLWLFLLGLAISMLTFIADIPMQFVVIFEAIDKDNQGLAVTIFTTTQYLLGHLPAPTIIGAIADATTIKFAFVFSFMWSIFCTIFWFGSWTYTYSANGSFTEGLKGLFSFRSMSSELLSTDFIENPSCVSSKSSIN